MSLLGSHDEKREMALRKENRKVPRKWVNVIVYLLMLLLGPQLSLFVFVRLVKTFIEIPDDQAIVFITTCIFILTALLKINFKVQRLGRGVVVILVVECQRSREGTFKIDFRRMHFVGLRNFDFLALQKCFHASAFFFRFDSFLIRILFLSQIDRNSLWCRHYCSHNYSVLISIIKSLATCNFFFQEIFSNIKHDGKKTRFTCTACQVKTRTESNRWLEKENARKREKPRERALREHFRSLAPWLVKHR